METNKEQTAIILQRPNYKRYVYIYCICYYEIVAHRCKTSCRAPLSLH